MAFPGHPLFDTSDYLADQLESLSGHPTLAEFLQQKPEGVALDWRQSALFLHRHAATPGSYSRFRGEVQRFLSFIWLVREKTLPELTGDDIDAYMEFLKKPPASWSTVNEKVVGGGRQRGFITKHGARVANPHWRPFFDSTTRRKSTTMTAAVASLTIFFKKLTMAGYLQRSPMVDATRRAQKASKSEHSGRQKSLGRPQQRVRRTAPRLTSWQWSYLLETLVSAANKDSRYERNLFVVVTMKALYLRVFELAPHGDPGADDYVEPTMGDFSRSVQDDGSYWDLYVCGKGGKERWIPLPEEYLDYLKRYRRYRNLPPLPSPNETSPMITRVDSEVPITNKRQIERIVEQSIELAASRMDQEGLKDSAAELRQLSKKTHILRHTGASMDLDAGRPIRDVSEDLGHDSAAFTEEVYIDTDTAKRYASGFARKVA